MSELLFCQARDVSFVTCSIHICWMDGWIKELIIFFSFSFYLSDLFYLYWLNDLCALHYYWNFLKIQCWAVSPSLETSLVLTDEVIRTSRMCGCKNPLEIGQKGGGKEPSAWGCEQTGIPGEMRAGDPRHDLVSWEVISQQHTKAATNRRWESLGNTANTEVRPSTPGDRQEEKSWCLNQNGHHVPDSIGLVLPGGWPNGQLG